MSALTDIRNLDDAALKVALIDLGQPAAPANRSQTGKQGPIGHAVRRHDEPAPGPAGRPDGGLHTRTHCTGRRAGRWHRQMRLPHRASSDEGKHSCEGPHDGVHQQLVGCSLSSPLRHWQACCPAPDRRETSIRCATSRCSLSATTTTGSPTSSTWAWANPCSITARPGTVTATEPQVGHRSASPSPPPASPRRKLGDDGQVQPRLGLHAAEDGKNQIMEINETNDLDSLRDALVYFHEKTGTRVTFEHPARRVQRRH